MKIASVDYGDSHTGIAACDKLEMIATPVCIIDEKRFEVCADKVADKIKELGAEMAVVGNPINMNGTYGPRSEKCREFAELLKDRLDIPVEMWDERSSTVTAHNIMNELDRRGKKRKAVIDAAAAAVILESYLAFRRNKNAQEKI